MITEFAAIGLAAAAHVASIFLGLSFSVCAGLLGGLVCAAAAGGIFFLLRCRKTHGGAETESKSFLYRMRPEGMWEGILYSVTAVLFLTQLLFIWIGDGVYRGGDLTVETVGSFLAENGLYQVNPLTGLPYTAGIPSRLKILCLPTLYGSLCKLTGMSPSMIVVRVIPTVILVSCYFAFGLLATVFFPEEGASSFREKRACFMTIVSLLLWVGAYQYGMDGFDLLCSGWRGVTIRNLVLIPWLLSLCLRKKWLLAILCVVCEACIVWTLYGCGVCLPVLAGMAVIQLFCSEGHLKKS